MSGRTLTAGPRLPILGARRTSSRAIVSPLRAFLALFVTAFVGVAGGLWSAWWVIQRGEPFGAVEAGPWRAFPSIGTPDADPYSRAIVARLGLVPLGAAEGLAFTARTDSEGRSLDGACTYRISGDTPSARLWTLSATDRAGGVLANQANRLVLTSREVLRDRDGQAVISVGAEVAPGNWLPISVPGPFQLVLRFYDTPAASQSLRTGLVLPSIVREGCR